MKVKKRKLALMYQTHSNKVIIINNSNKHFVKFADAIITKVKGLALGVVTADCVPIILLTLKIKLLDVFTLDGKAHLKELLKIQLKNLKN